MAVRTHSHVSAPYHAWSCGTPNITTRKLNGGYYTNRTSAASGMWHSSLTQWRCKAPTPSLRGSAVLRVAAVTWLAFGQGWIGPASVVEGAVVDVAAWNVQTFGVTKMRNRAVANVLATVVRRHDVVAVQEVRDATGTAVRDLLTLINTNGGGGFALLESPRYGRINSSYRESYAWYYRTARITPVWSGDWVNTTRGELGLGVGNDTTRAFPARTPHAVRWRVAGTAAAMLTTVVFHADPDDVVEEMHAVGLAVQPLTTSGDAVLVMGDLNADCSYLSQSERQCAVDVTCNHTEIALLEPQQWQWLVNDSVDTTVGESDCAYDRLILATASTGVVPVPPGAQVERDTLITPDVSDHFPVYLVMEFVDNATTLQSTSSQAITTPQSTTTSLGMPTTSVPGSSGSNDGADSSSTTYVIVGVVVAVVIFGVFVVVVGYKLRSSGADGHRGSGSKVVRNSVYHA
eukprot:m.81526 g.81526  ORF g.81526 m.81526 type:complete len:460 (-) comp9409_c0_seq1:1767-3146(-)